MTDLQTNSDIQAMLDNAARSAKRNPSIRLQGVGDGFQATVTSSSVRDLKAFDPEKPPVKTMIIELNLDLARSQMTKKLNNATGFIEEAKVEGTAWTWFVRTGSQALFELSRAVKEGGGLPGSPSPGDHISAKLVGLKPSPKGPNPTQVIEVRFIPGSKSEDHVNRVTAEEEF